MYMIERQQLCETQWREGERPDVTSVAFGKAGVRLCSGTHSVWATDLLQDSLRRLTHAPSGSAARREGEKRLRIICFSKPLVLSRPKDTAAILYVCPADGSAALSEAHLGERTPYMVGFMVQTTALGFGSASQKLGEVRQRWDSAQFFLWTQGPLHGKTEHFFQLVLENNNLKLHKSELKE